MRENNTLAAKKGKQARFTTIPIDDCIRLAKEYDSEVNYTRVYVSIQMQLPEGPT